jgi:hypothetical protein
MGLIFLELFPDSQTNCHWFTNHTPIEGRFLNGSLLRHRVYHQIPDYQDFLFQVSIPEPYPSPTHLAKDYHHR